jgi:hypothetical protein
MYLLLILNILNMGFYSYGVYTWIETMSDGMLFIRAVLCGYLFIKTLDKIVDIYARRYNLI